MDQYFIPFYCQQFSIIWIDHILFIYSSVDGHLRFFHFSAITNNATGNIHGQDLRGLMFLFLLGEYLREEMLGHIETLVTLCSRVIVRTKFCVPSSPLTMKPLPSTAAVQYLSIMLTNLPCSSVIPMWFFVTFWKAGTGSLIFVYPKAVSVLPCIKQNSVCAFELVGSKSIKNFMCLILQNVSKTK